MTWIRRAWRYIVDRPPNPTCVDALFPLLGTGGSLACDPVFANYRQPSEGCPRPVPMMC
jgi:hypothetical protein